MDQSKQQSIINFLVHCPKGIMFLKSIDTSGLTKDANTLFEIFDEVVKILGPQILFNSLLIMMYLIKLLRKSLCKV